MKTLMGSKSTQSNNLASYAAWYVLVSISPTSSSLVFDSIFKGDSACSSSTRLHWRAQQICLLVHNSAVKQLMDRKTHHH